MLIKDIAGYENMYQISSCGYVISKARKTNNGLCKEDKKMTIFKDRYGYCKVNLTKNGKSKIYSVHRLVAEAFIPNPNNYSAINHINEIKDDNRVENLEWCSIEYNNKYNGKMGKLFKSNERKVSQLDIDGNLIKDFDSLKEASVMTGISSKLICACCRGKRKTTNGYKWRYG